MPESLLTIVFRGLMVVNVQGEGEDAFCEVGVLSTAPGHFFRVTVVKNCVLETVRHIKKGDLDTANRDWEIKIVNPVEKGITLDQKGEPFDRKSHGFAEDFRWSIDLEEVKFYNGDLKDRIDTSILKPIIRIPNGRLYTRLKSRRLDRITIPNQTEVGFGCISVALGCDIKLKEDTKVVLKTGGLTDFTFNVGPNDPHTIFEIVNSPPDIQEPEHHHDLPDEHPEDHAAEDTVIDHFEHYYLMFKKDPNLVKFKFTESGGPPGPRPTLCGMVRLGQRTLDL